LLLSPDLNELFAMMSGGVEFAITAMRYSCDRDIETFLAKWDNARQWDKQKIPIQGWALAAGLDPTRFLGAVMLAIRDYSADQVKLIAMCEHPEIMKARVANAKRPDGQKDRDAIDLMLGALPLPKGATFITKQYINAGTGSRPSDMLPENSSQEDDKVIDASAVDANFLFPTLCDTQKAITQKNRMIEAPLPGPKIVDSEEEEYDISELEALIG
jgi:hypothetical protein